MSESTAARLVLARAQDGLARRRRAEVDELEVLLEWADLHGGDPQDEPGAVSAARGGPKLVQLGGDGTPGVEDLCVDEIAIARSAGVVASEHVIGEVLDLRHRLPQLWAGLKALRCDAWVGRRVARMSRSLSLAQVGLVDIAVTAAIDESPARILRIAEATIIEADLDAHRARIEANQTRRGVWISTPRTGDVVDAATRTAGVRTVFGRLEDAGALELSETIDHLADALAEHGTHAAGNPSNPSDPGDRPTRDQLRAEAMAMLADPAAALTLLTKDSGPRRVPRPRATLNLHLCAQAVKSGVGVARVDRFGPVLLDQLANLLGRRDITVQPVIDLNQVTNVNAYEHPASMKQRTQLRTVTDVYPHSTTAPGAQVDHDHCTPYNRQPQPPGPPRQPGQTTDRNDGPLTRRHHRGKTHAGLKVEQLQLGIYRWTTPNGLTRIVTPHGTKTVEPLHNPDGTITGELYFT